jgi:hypothetical protein
MNSHVCTFARDEVPFAGADESRQGLRLLRQMLLHRSFSLQRKTISAETLLPVSTRVFPQAVNFQLRGDTRVIAFTL